MCVLLGVSACAAWAPELAECSAPALAALPVSKQCLATDEARGFLKPHVQRFAEKLERRRTREGAVRLSLTLADDSSEGRVCVEEVSGDGMLQRASVAAATFRRLPPPPACMAGRRVALDWSSALVTHEHVEQAEAECAEELGSHARVYEFCRLQSNCRTREIERLRALHRRDLSACRLRKVPLAFRLDGGRQTVYFAPGPYLSPAQEEVLAVMEHCQDAVDHADLTVCMRGMGWKLVGTEIRSEWLFE